MNKAGVSGTVDSSSSTCYGGVCMPACSQMVLDRWLLIFGLFLVVWLYVFVCFFLYSICMCLLVFFVFVFLVFLWWWKLHASVLADGPGQVALDIWFVCFFFLCLFVNVFLFVSFLVFMRWLVLACLCCWWNLRACLLADDFGQTVFLGSRGGISILDWMNDFLSSEFEHSICLFLLGSDCHYQNSTWITNTWGKWSPLPPPPPYHSTLDVHRPLERWTLWE